MSVPSSDGESYPCSDYSLSQLLHAAKRKLQGAVSDGCVATGIDQIELNALEQDATEVLGLVRSLKRSFEQPHGLPRSQHGVAVSSPKITASSSHATLSPHSSTNVSPTTTANGAGATDKFAQVLKQCESGIKPEAEAQEVVDQLDQILDGKPDEFKKKQYLIPLVKICEKYCIVPTSHLIPEIGLERVGDSHPDGKSVVWPGSYRKLDQAPNVEPESVSIRVFPLNARDPEKVKRRLCHEAAIWRRISHPNILSFIGMTLSNEPALVYPSMGNGDILDYLRKNGDANPIKLLEESIIGLKYLHDIGFVHGSLQWRHILVTDDGHARLANVGNAGMVHEGDSQLDGLSVLTDNRNIRYSPPEYFMGGSESTYITKPGDMYSIGMTIYEILSDKVPFQDHNSITVVMQIVNGARPKKPDFAITRGYTEGLWELTTACWHQDPKKRLTVDEVLGVLGETAPKWKPGV